jgi:hypothetical protein
LVRRSCEVTRKRAKTIDTAVRAALAKANDLEFWVSEKTETEKTTVVVLTFFFRALADAVKPLLEKLHEIQKADPSVRFGSSVPNFLQIYCEPSEIKIGLEVSTGLYVSQDFDKFSPEEVAERVRSRSSYETYEIDEIIDIVLDTITSNVEMASDAVEDRITHQKALSRRVHELGVDFYGAPSAPTETPKKASRTTRKR